MRLSLTGWLWMVGVFTLTPMSLMAELKIAVASNFLAPLKAIKLQFESKTDRELALVTGSTGKLYAQIKHGAPYDVFMSADTSRPEQLIDEDYVKAGFDHVYAVGRLAFSCQGAHAQIKSLSDLANTTAHLKIAIANPKTAPYGLAAEEALSHLWPQLPTHIKLIYGENISHTYQYFASGHVDCAFVALSQVKDNKRYKADYVLVPNEMHSPIKQKMVALKSSAQSQALEDFFNFIKSQDATDILSAHGYEVEPNVNPG